MPYASDKQRKFFHAALNRGDLSAKVVNEFDQASKGRKLPEYAKPSKPKFPRIKKLIKKDY